MSEKLQCDICGREIEADENGNDDYVEIGKLHRLSDNCGTYRCDETFEICPVCMAAINSKIQELNDKSGVEN